MKFYRVKKDTFLWKEGAILKLNNDATGYIAVEDIWDAVSCINREYISARIIEHPGNSEFFERVYPDSIKGKLFRTKDKLISMYKEAFE
jgi:hypothetical protein